MCRRGFACGRRPRQSPRRIIVPRFSKTRNGLKLHEIFQLWVVRLRPSAKNTLAYNKQRGVRQNMKCCRNNQGNRNTLCEWIDQQCEKLKVEQNVYNEFGASHLRQSFQIVIFSLFVSATKMASTSIKHGASLAQAVGKGYPKINNMENRKMQTQTQKR